MRLSLFIARRYLFSKKKQNAINIISAISVVGVAVGTCALIVVLSVFNGMDLLLQKSTGSFTPDLVVSPAEGKYADFDTAITWRLCRQSLHATASSRKKRSCATRTTLPPSSSKAWTQTISRTQASPPICWEAKASCGAAAATKGCLATAWQPACTCPSPPAAPWSATTRTN